MSAQDKPVGVVSRNQHASYFDAALLLPRMAYRLTKVIKSHAGPLNAIDTLENMAITASEDTTLKVFSLSGLKLLVTYTHHKMGVNDVKTASLHMYSCGQDRRIKSVDLCTSKVVTDYVGHTQSVTTLDANGILVSGSADRSVRMWDTRTGREIAKFVGHSNIVTKVLAGDKVVSSSMDGTVRVWDRRSSNVLYFSTGVRTIESSDDKLYIVLRDSVCALNAQLQQVSRYPYRGVRSILCSGASVYFGCNGFIRMQKQDTFVDVKCRGSIECMAVHGHYILCGGEDRTLQVVENT